MDKDALGKIVHLLERYEPSPEAIQLVQQTSILLIVGITGAGKDTVRSKLIESPAYHRIVSHTTRAPRVNDGVPEQDGVEYHFIDLVTATAMLEHGDFVESKVYSGNVYGTSIKEIAAANRYGKTALADIEVQGVAEYKALSPAVLAVYLLPPSYDTWMQRLLARYAGHKVDKKDLHERMETAVRELEHAIASDYYVFVVNDDLAKTVQYIDDLAHHRRSAAEDAEAKALANGLLQSIQSRLATQG